MDGWSITLVRSVFMPVPNLDYLFYFEMQTKVPRKKGKVLTESEQTRHIRVCGLNPQALLACVNE